MTSFLNYYTDAQLRHAADVLGIVSNNPKRDLARKIGHMDTQKNTPTPRQLSPRRRTGDTPMQVQSPRPTTRIPSTPVPINQSRVPEQTNAFIHKSTVPLFDAPSPSTPTPMQGRRRPVQTNDFIKGTTSLYDAPLRPPETPLFSNKR